MFTYRKLYIIVAIVMMQHFKISDAMKCKWSNEDCSSDKQCCSGRCVRLHEGTNPRCASSPIHYPCIFSYQCEDGLSCGEHYNCCAPYWGICSEKNDCCDAHYVCREEEGFIYNRCLAPNDVHGIHGTNMLLINLLQACIIYVWNEFY